MTRFFGARTLRVPAVVATTISIHPGWVRGPVCLEYNEID